jgi:hypothetical protein
MGSAKYVGMDVHKDTISIAVMNSAGKPIMESIIETKAITILQFIQGLQGDVYVTFEEGTWAAWLYDLLKPHVTQVVVCNQRKNALLKQGSKSDQMDARKYQKTVKPKRKSAERRSPRGERRFEPYGPSGLNSLNRRMRTRMYGGVAGESGRPLPLCRFFAMRSLSSHLAYKDADDRIHISPLSAVSKASVYSNPTTFFRRTGSSEVGSEFGR